eukprot:SAG22_NODE_2612_length_2381_cov_2.086766_5_plen_117_part_00
MLPFATIQIWERCAFGAQGQTMERPTNIVKHTVRYARTILMVEEFLRIDVSEMLRAVMLAVTLEPGAGRLFVEDQRQQYSAGYIRPPENPFHQQVRTNECLERPGRTSLPNLGQTF